MKDKKWKIDYVLLSAISALTLFGIVFLAILSTPFSLEVFGTTNYFLFHQLLRGLIPGIVLGVIFFIIPLSFIVRITPILFLLSLLLSTLVFFPIIGLNYGGASRWINFGIFSFQPSELLKLSVIMYLGLWFKKKFDKGGEGNPSLKKIRRLGYFSKKLKFHQARYNLKNFFIPFSVLIGVISLILILQPDISTLGVIVLVSILIYFSGGTPLWHVILMIFGGLSSLLILIKISPYRFYRLLLFLQPELDPLGMGFQIKQSLIAVGSGGITGQGLGMSSQKLGFLPHPMSDSVFAVIAEETGFIGSFILILVFLIIFWRGIKIAKSTNDKFLGLTALGISSWIIIQSFVNISALTGVLPLTGIPLPFISYGSSHLVVELIAAGILLNISRNV